MALLISRKLIQIPTNHLLKCNFSHSIKDIPRDKNLSFPLKFSRPSQNTKVLDTETKISKLHNGLTVASQYQFGLQCTIGTLVNCAPRYEARHISGISHFIEKLGFQSSEGFQNKNDVLTVLDECGAIFDCQLGRDLLIYGISGEMSKLERLVKLLGDVVLRPKITPEEVEIARQVIDHEIRAMRMIPPADLMMQDLIHQAAFRNNTLGLPRYTPSNNINLINRKNIINFMAINYRPESMILIGVGVDHNELVNYAEKYFVPFADYISNDKDVEKNIVEQGVDHSVPQMTGGEVLVEQDLVSYHHPMPEFAHVSLGLESCGMKDPQFTHACLLQTLMGGGGSFSAGGPGKGMLSRLYVEVLYRHPWVNSVVANNHSYSDTGLFTLTGSAVPGNVDMLALVLADQLKRMVRPIDSEELERAKSQLKSMLFMNLECRPIVFEDIGRQVIYQGFRNSADFWVEQINKITSQELQDLAHRMLLSKPAMAGFGKLEKLPSLDKISEILAKSEKFTPKTFCKYL